MYMNGYRCIACESQQSAGFKDFQCPDCGGNLDIDYDYAASAAGLAGGFGAAPRGMFRYQALLPLDPAGEPCRLQIGGTPLYAAARLGAQAGLNRLYIKDESRNPSASFKDRASAVAILRAIEVSADCVSVASTGNAGSSLACLAAAHGIPAVVFVPEAAPAAKLAQSMACGAQVLAVRGSYDDAYDLCMEASREFGWFNRSTGFNPFTREGKKTCAFEIWEDLGCRVPDRVMVPCGDGNIISGIWKGFGDLQAAGLADRLPKLDCIQSTASNAICQTVWRLRGSAVPVADWSAVTVDEVQASTLADSISVNQPRDGLAAVKAVLNSGGEAVAVSDESMLVSIAEMAALTGVYPEPAAAAPWAAVRQMARQGLVDPGETIVILMTGSGLKDVSTATRAAGTSTVIEPDLDSVRAALGE